MDQKPDANPPVARGVDAVKDIGAAVDFVLKRRNISRLNLIGHSWGTVLIGGVGLWAFKKLKSRKSS